MKIKTLVDIPEFVFMDMKTYPAYAKGEIADYPWKAVELLVAKKMVEKLTECWHCLQLETISDVFPVNFGEGNKPVCKKCMDELVNMVVV